MGLKHLKWYNASLLVAQRTKSDFSWGGFFGGSTRWVFWVCTRVSEPWLHEPLANYNVLIYANYTLSYSMGLEERDGETARDMAELLLMQCQGKVPVNEYGNVELFQPWMLPKGTLHIRGLLCSWHRQAYNICCTEATKWQVDSVTSETFFQFLECFLYQLILYSILRQFPT